MSALAVACAALDEGSSDALAALFDRVGSTCFCGYFHFDGDKNAWLARLFHEPDRNRAELAERARAPGLHGVVARLDDGRVVGWMKLEPALSLPKLYAQRTYKNLPVFAADRAHVWTIGCFLVEPEFRRRGVGRALLAKGIELARAEGARSLEAFPRRAEGVPDEQLFTGPFALFASEGFAVVHEQAQYPVLRRDL